MSSGIRLSRIGGYVMMQVFRRPIVIVLYSESLGYGSWSDVVEVMWICLCVRFRFESLFD